MFNRIHIMTIARRVAKIWLKMLVWRVTQSLIKLFSS